MNSTTQRRWSNHPPRASRSSTYRGVVPPTNHPVPHPMDSQWRPFKAIIGAWRPFLRSPNPYLQRSTAIAQNSSRRSNSVSGPTGAIPKPPFLNSCGAFLPRRLVLLALTCVPMRVRPHPDGMEEPLQRGVRIYQLENFALSSAPINR